MLGTVRPTPVPPWFTTELRITAQILSPSRSASLSRFRTTTPHPSARTYPSAEASKVLHCPTGESIIASARSS